MSTARPALCTRAESLCGISCRRKATLARSRGPEAVGAFTLLMWETTEHGEAGFSLAPAHCYWSWTETWTRCRQLEDIVCNCAKSDNGGWYRRNDSIVISAHVGLHVSLGRRASRPAQPAPTRCVGRQNVLCIALSKERRKPWPSAGERLSLCTALSNINGRRYVTSWKCRERITTRRTILHLRSDETSTWVGKKNKERNGFSDLVSVSAGAC